MEAPILSDEQLEALAYTEELDWENMPDLDKQFFRELKEREIRRKREIEDAPKHDYQPIPYVLRHPKQEDFNMEWWDYQQKFLLHPDLAKTEVTRRARAWKRKNRYKQPPSEKEVPDLTQEEAKDLFFYMNGELYYRNPIARKTKRGDMVAPPREDKRPRRIRIRYREYPLSHIVFLYHKGVLPRRIKHIDGDTQNVEISNLLEV